MLKMFALVKHSGEVVKVNPAQYFNQKGILWMVKAFSLYIQHMYI